MKTLSATLVILFACLPVLTAKTVEIADENLRIEIPDTWTSIPKPGLLLYAMDSQKISAVCILASPNAPNKMLDSGFINEMEQGMVEEGPKIGATITISDQNPTTLNGVPAYLIHSKTVLANTKTMIVSTYVVSANTKIYSIFLQTLDASEQPELQTIANSFQFTTAPELPDPSRDTVSYKAGQVVGGVIGVFVAFLAAYLAIKFMAKLITRIFRRKSE